MSYQDTYEAWLNSPALSAQEKAELESIRTDEKEKESRFFDQLSFGTAGLRGIMGVGLYRMNVHVIRHATQAFAQVILEEGAQAAQRGVAICFDCRNNSQTFAREAAQVMAANGIPVRLFQALRPTPELSSPCGSMAASPASTSPPATTPRSITAIRSIGRTVPSCPPSTPTRWPKR